MKDPRTRPEEYSDGYAYRRSHLWKCLDLDDGYANVISFFCPTTPDHVTFPPAWRDTYNKGKPDKPVTGKVFVPKEFEHDVEFCAKRAIDMLTDKIYTSKLTKGRRRTLRKSFEGELDKSQYDWIALTNYLRQAFLEGSKKVILSRKEIAMLQPTLTKKEEKKRSIDKALRDNFISY